jgi:putative transposase
MVSVSERITAVRHAIGRGISQRKACTLLQVSRSMLAYAHRMPMRRQPLVEQVRRVIANRPSWGCEMVREVLEGKGIAVSRNRMHRLWKAEKLQVSLRKTRRKFRTGARLNPLPTVPNSVWCTDFAEDRAGGRKMFVFLVKDEATGYCLTSKARSSWKGVDVRAELDRLVAIHGAPDSIRSDNGGQYISRAVVGWASKHRVAQAFIVPGRPWQNGAAESLVATLRRECLDVELFATLEVGQIRLERWRRIYNQERPHCRAAGKPPATAYLNKQAVAA